MVLRQTEHAVIAIGQPSHAWISGQLARAWGAERFGGLEPWEEVCLAAEQHDLGMAIWDLSPTRNPETGLPQSFIEMPLRTHLELWRAAPRRLLEQSRYAALLVSMHGLRLYERRDLDKLEPAEAAEVTSFLRERRDFQEELLDTLRVDAATADWATPTTVARNSDLIWAWDFLSLALCLDWAPCSSPPVPSRGPAVKLQLTPAADGAVVVEPWPFASRTVTVRCEGRRLTDRFETDQALSDALARAPWEIVRFELRSA
jgi:hypothetical protein